MHWNDSKSGKCKLRRLHAVSYSPKPNDLFIESKQKQQRTILVVFYFRRPSYIRMLAAYVQALKKQKANSDHHDSPSEVTAEQFIPDTAHFAWKTLHELCM